MPNVELIDTRLYSTQRADEAVEEAWNDGSLESLFHAPDLGQTKVKLLVRKGVPDGIRIWPEFLKMHKMPGLLFLSNHFKALSETKTNSNVILSRLEFGIHLEYDKNYSKALFRVYGSQVPPQITPPLFGFPSVPSDQFELFLNKRGLLSASRIIAIVAHDYPNIDYCPFLPALTYILLHHLQPDDVLGTLNFMIKESLGVVNPLTGKVRKEKLKMEDRHWCYFPTYKKDIKVFNIVFAELLSKTHPKIHKHITDLQSPYSNTPPIWSRWFCNMFLGVFPLTVLFRILDSYIIEGYKVLYRYGLAYLYLQSERIFACDTLDELKPLFMYQTFNISVDKLTKQAFSYQFTRDKVKQIRNSLSIDAISDSSLHEPESSNVYTQLRPKLCDPSSFITDTQWERIWSWIPSRYRFHELDLIFTTKKHGHSLSTFYDLVREREPTLILIETLSGFVIGAYCSKSWPNVDDFNKFIGTGETFIFSLTPKVDVYYWVEANTRSEYNESPLKSSVSGAFSENESGVGIETKKSENSDELDFAVEDRKDCFMMGTSKDLTIGGGGSGQAIWLNQSLTSGTTDTCATFNNQPLIPTKHFEIATIEVFWFRGF
ncbi:TLD-domain-containing protein [Paraphysoderma sedebokerense]|nr:TLD-domain-containing protein [Paraphysoderma sedebokerense]